MDQTVEDRLEAARAAHQRGSWRESFELLHAADTEDGLAPPDLVMLAEAAWLSGEPDLAIEARERAHAAFLQQGDEVGAAQVALSLAGDHFARMEHAIGNGWTARAGRLLEGKDECVGHAFQALNQAMIAFKVSGDMEEARVHAAVAREIAERLGIYPMRILAMQLEGHARVSLGDIAAGMALVDEATVAAVSGELDPFTTGIVYCSTIALCRDTGDWRRAGEWTDAAQRWCSKTGINGFPGICRVHRAEVMHFRGAWADAEREARQACEELKSYDMGFTAKGLYEIGEVRRRVGDLDGARKAFRQSHELGFPPEPGMSLVRLDEGDTDAARASIRRVLAGGGAPLDRAQLLPAGAKILQAAGDLEGAEAAVTELESIAAQYDTAGLRGAASYARGRLETARGHWREAESALQTAVQSWHAVGAPYEVARSQTALGEAYRGDGDESSARLELETAKEAFERLGGIPDARRVDELLGGAGEVATRAGGRVTRTFVFTDIVASTELVSALGDEAWQQLIHWHDQTLRSSFNRHGGTEVRHTGDGFFIVFEQAVTAIEAAVTIQRALDEHRRAHGFAPQVRIGLHQADADVRAMDYSGKGVHEAARVGALAQGGEILASLGTVEGLGQRFPVSQPRSVRLKGVDQPVDVVSIDWR